MSPYLLSPAEVALGRLPPGAVEKALRDGAGRWLPPDALAAAHEGRPRALTLDGMRSSPLAGADRALALAALSGLTA